MKLTLIIPIVFATAVITLAAIGCRSISSSPAIPLGAVTDFRFERTWPLAQDMPAPDFQFTMPDGGAAFLSDFKGKVVLLNFWGVDCPYCIAEMPYLQQAHSQLSEQGAVVIAINTGDAENRVQKFVNSKKLTFPVILDPDVYASLLYGARYLPTTCIIDKSGNLRVIKIGAFKNALEVINTLNAYLE